MKFQSKNMHYVFHREYFDGLELLRENGAPTRTVEERNQAVFSFAFPKADLFAGLRELPNFRSFELVTTYPGLLVGTGNPHDAKLEAAIKLGFSFDYVTGLPYLPGSSLKGMLRSRFPGKYGGEDKTDREILIGAYLGRDDIDAEALETEIFTGNDTFLGAFPTDWPDGMLSMEYITPHKDFQDPIPISLLKIRPNVCLEFGFLLSDSIVSATEKCGLFRELVMESGIGAKTNVGYGRLVKPEGRPKRNRIGYDPARYAEMNRLMKARAAAGNRPVQRNAAPGKRPPQPQQGRPQRNVLGTCPNCGADIVGGNKFPSCAGNCGFRPGRPRGYRKPVTDDEYRKLLNGEQVLMRGFEDNWGNTYSALVRFKGVQAPQTDRNTGETVRYGEYQVERQL